MLSQPRPRPPACLPAFTWTPTPAARRLLLFALAGGRRLPPAAPPTNSEQTLFSRQPVMSPVRLQCAVCVMGKGGAHVVIASPRWEELHRCSSRAGQMSVQLKQKLTFRFHDSRASAVLSSSVKRFHFPFARSV